MEQLIGAGASQGGADLIKNSTTATFMEDVVDASQEVPVIVDFWAPWCGPCKQLGPLLEKAVRDARGAVRMVKVNIDESPEIAQQMRIQSIPAVYAFKGGRPVDGFVGAVPESQIKQFIDRLTGGAGSPLDDALAEAEAAMQEGHNDEALGIFQEILAQDPTHVKALAGALRCYMALDQDDMARQLIEKLPAPIKNSAEVQGVQAALDLKAATANTGNAEVEKLEAQVAADPKDMQSRLDLAMARYGAGDKAKAVDDLLAMIKADRAWNEQAARKQLVKFFEAFGPADPLTLTGRRRLSAILFS